MLSIWAYLGVSNALGIKHNKYLVLYEIAYNIIIMFDIMCSRKKEGER